MVQRDIGTIESLQMMLRNIAGEYTEIPLVIPDGIFGSDTLESVQSFQQRFGLEADGVVNFETWNKIVEISDSVDSANDNGRLVLAYNENNRDILPGETVAELYAIQGMMKALGVVSDGFDDITVTGTHDMPSVNAVKKIQLISGLEDNGIITVEFYNNLTHLYEVYVTRRRI